MLEIAMEQTGAANPAYMDKLLQLDGWPRLHTLTPEPPKPPQPQAPQALPALPAGPMPPQPPIV